MPDRLLRGLNGPRGSVLLAASVLAAVHAAVYVRAGERLIIESGLELVDRFTPLPVLAFLWSLAAVLGFAGAFRAKDGRQRDMPDAWGFGLIAGLLYAWGFAFLSAFILRGFAVEGFAFGIIYVSVAVMVSSSTRMTNPTTRAGGRTR